eukprot:m.33845 g.33845  ORF g.33845 m.33845 type:complete len:213 (+) comp43299_c0_seq2:86-724(+)
MEINVDTFNEPTAVRLLQPGVTVYRNLEPSAPGTLYITENEIIFWDDVHQTGLQIQYEQLALHAISRDTTRFAFPCLFCQLEGIPAPIKLGTIGVPDSEDDDKDEDYEDAESEDDVIELRIVPEDHTAIEKMYEVLCECQALHPDDDDEDAGEMYSAFQFAGLGNGAAEEGDEGADEEDLEDMTFPVALTDANGNPIEDDEEEDEENFADAD